MTSLDFDDQGDYLVSSGDDETIQIFDIKEGKTTKSVPSKKYGAHLARFTHHSRQVLHASTKVDGMSRHVMTFFFFFADAGQTRCDCLIYTMKDTCVIFPAIQTR